MTDWLKADGSDTLLTLKVVPRARKSEICAVEGAWLKVRLKAPPLEGRANAALIELLATTLQVPRRAVELISGDTSRLKRVRLHGVGAARCAALLTPGTKA